VLQLSNEVEDPNKDKAVLTILYVYDTDQLKKYEISLDAGEYTWQAVMDRIKEKLNPDRKDVRYGKKTFILVDLHENTQFA